ncbi:hypothetical protein EP073_12730 [Geovibrio thiophilus]|uniref:DUF4845 domain-containing protein n=1 Tax=Geovibrio thiophilus TaxID=139438 RepID=A0A410K1B6_9BACT|nr:hypothetical protein [Geovibrio thiophilus]QAR34237.1 hypothetical protein EP073_12730 [Geovibrio thiophilus]
MGTFVRVIIFIIVLYLGAMAALPWIKYKMFENAFENAVDSSNLENIPVNIAKAAEDVGIPVTEEDVIIEEYVDKRKFSVTYDAEAELPFKTLKFTYTIEGYKNIEAE